MQSSYNSSDVTLLLKDITGLVKPLSTEKREELIQGGFHYSEMLPLEYKPTEKYIDAYNVSLNNYAQITADAVCQVSEKIYSAKGKNIVLVSLARAGIPIGILIKHYLSNKYKIDVPHYGISIIRGRGIDHNAMKHILNNHIPQDLQFIDGWIGKGAITKELASALKDYPEVSKELAVLADPANITDLCGTHEDILIPSSCLNCTISGLISRTFFRDDIVGPLDFHGAACFKELLNEDVSYEFINTIENYFDFSTTAQNLPKGQSGLEEVKSIAEKFNITDINFIKPGIGEATRVLLRRVPWKLLINEKDKDDPALLHLLRLAEEKHVPIEYCHLENYKACGIIKKLADA